MMNWLDISAAAVTLFFVMDPFGNVPLFDAILSRYDSRTRVRIVARELIFALIILLTFLFTGTAVLDFLGLSQQSLNIAGGVLLFIIALKIIFPSTSSRQDGGFGDHDPFIVPLAMPLVAGPSTIALLLLMSSSQPDRIWDWCIALLLAWAGTTVLLTAAPFLTRLLGTRGSRALAHLAGMILILLATQMLLNGIADFVASLE